MLDSSGHQISIWSLPNHFASICSELRLPDFQLWQSKPKRCNAMKQIFSFWLFVFNIGHPCLSVCLLFCSTASQFQKSPSWCGVALNYLVSLRYGVSITECRPLLLSTSLPRSSRPGSLLSGPLAECIKHTRQFMTCCMRYHGPIKLGYTPQASSLISSAAGYYTLMHTNRLCLCIRCLPYGLLWNLLSMWSYCRPSLTF